MSPISATLGRTLADDPVFPAAEQLPLSRPLGVLPDGAPVPAATDRRPFGLRFAVVPAQAVPVDRTELRYDADRQVSVDGTGTPVYGKHSTGQTSTRTSDGHKSMDSDTDHTED